MLYYPDKLKSNNPKAYGISDFKEVCGSRTVKTVNDLYSIDVCKLTTDGTGTDSAGCIWYVSDIDQFYYLFDFSKRTTAQGWKTIDVDDAVKTTGDQTVDGIKTFQKLPESTQEVTKENQLVTKKYADGLVLQVFKYKGKAKSISEDQTTIIDADDKSIKASKDNIGWLYIIIDETKQNKTEYASDGSVWEKIGFSTNDYTDEDKFKVDHSVQYIKSKDDKYTSVTIGTRLSPGEGKEEYSNVGIRSMVIGDSSESSGRASLSVGLANKNRGKASVTEGSQNETGASEYDSTIDYAAGTYACSTNGLVFRALKTISHISPVPPPTTAGTSTEYWSYIGDNGYQHAEGSVNKAIGESAHAEGTLNTASGSYSHAEGANNAVSNRCGHVEGISNIVSGDYSHAEGQETTATSVACHVEGYKNNAKSGYSHAEGYYTDAEGISAHSEGHATTAGADYSHAEGNMSYAYGAASHAEGESTNAGPKIWSSTTNYVTGDYCTCIFVQEEKLYNQYYKALQNNKGKQPPISTEYWEVVADLNKYQHSEGYSTKAIGQGTHAEGSQNTSIGKFSHTEGLTNITNGIYSHAEGENNTVNGECSHSEGMVNTINGSCSHVEGIQNKVNGSYSHAEGYGNITRSPFSHAEGSINRAGVSEYDSSIEYIMGDYCSISKEVGSATITIVYKALETVTGKAPTGEKTSNEYWEYIDRTNGGQSNQHVEGITCMCIGNAAHAEGIYTCAEGDFSHTEGYYTYTRGQTSHAEGAETQTNGECSHAEGYGTIAEAFQHVSGVGNIQDIENKFAVIVGGATLTEQGGHYVLGERKNIETTSWKGVHWNSTDVTAGNTNDDPLYSLKKASDELFFRNYRTVDAVTHTYDFIRLVTFESQTLSKLKGNIRSISIRSANSIKTEAQGIPHKSILLSGQAIIGISSNSVIMQPGINVYNTWYFNNISTSGYSEITFGITQELDDSVISTWTRDTAQVVSYVPCSIQDNNPAGDHINYVDPNDQVIKVWSNTTADFIFNLRSTGESAIDDLRNRKQDKLTEDNAGDGIIINTENDSLTISTVNAHSTELLPYSTAVGNRANATLIRFKYSDIELHNKYFGCSSKLSEIWIGNTPTSAGGGGIGNVYARIIEHDGINPDGNISNWNVIAVSDNIQCNQVYDTTNPDTQYMKFRFSSGISLKPERSYMLEFSDIEEFETLKSVRINGMAAPDSETYNRIATLDGSGNISITTLGCSCTLKFNGDSTIKIATQITDEDSFAVTPAKLVKNSLDSTKTELSTKIDTTKTELDTKIENEVKSTAQLKDYFYSKKFYTVNSSAVTTNKAEWLMLGVDQTKKIHGVVRKISLKTVSDAQEGNYKLVAWLNDGGDHDDQHNKVIGVSTNSLDFSTNPDEFNVWSFNGFTIPANYRLILTVSESTHSDEELLSQKWSTRSEYVSNCLPVSSFNSSGVNGNQVFYDDNYHYSNIASMILDCNISEATDIEYTAATVVNTWRDDVKWIQYGINNTNNFKLDGIRTFKLEGTNSASYPETLPEYKCILFENNSNDNPSDSNTKLIAISKNSAKLVKGDGKYTIWNFDDIKVSDNSKIVITITDAANDDSIIKTWKFSDALTNCGLMRTRNNTNDEKDNKILKNNGWIIEGDAASAIIISKVTINYISKLNDINQYLINIDSSIIQINQHLTNIDSSITDINTQLGTHTTNISEINQHLGTIDGSITDINTQLGTHTTNISTINEHLNTVDSSIDEINEKCDTYNQILINPDTETSNINDTFYGKASWIQIENTQFESKLIKQISLRSSDNAESAPVKLLIFENKENSSPNNSNTKLIAISTNVVTIVGGNQNYNKWSFNDISVTSGNHIALIGVDGTISDDIIKTYDWDTALTNKKVIPTTVDNVDNSPYSIVFKDTEHANALSNIIFKYSDKVTVLEKKINSLGSISTKNFWKGTQDEYDAITEKDENTLYFIIEG